MDNVKLDAVDTQHRPRRTDDLGRAFKGSQRQIQIAVARRTEELSKAILTQLRCPDGTQLVWKSPLEKDEFKEYRDESFLEAVNLKGSAPKLAEFWPPRGPHWDGLAILEENGETTGIVLVEAKSYPLEMYGPGCNAELESERRKLIERSTKVAKDWFHADSSGDCDWLGPYYQFANRLSHIYFLRERAGIDAWLVNLCFVNDETRHPTSKEDWKTGLELAKKKLGLKDEVINKYVADVFLDASDLPWPPTT